MKDAIKNQVVSNHYKKSENFFTSDLIFRTYLKEQLSADAFQIIKPYLKYTGRKAALEMDQLSLDADKNPPELIKRDFFGTTLNRVKFHPAYDQLMKIAVESGMFSLKWQPENREKLKQQRHRAGFASGYLYALSELGQYCPLCMTDGVARLIDLHMNQEDREKLLPKIATTNVDKLYTGAMFLTEKSGGSDVGRNIVKANKIEGDRYALHGEKWFCSNVNADLIFALARTDENKTGTRGLSIFLIQKSTAEGADNPLPIVRLKDKLGVRSMASAECVMEGTEGRLVGEEFNGFKIMTDMINLSRLYNAVAAISGARRALVEAYTFNLYRTSFGKNAIEHALIRDKLWELGTLHVAGFYLTWNTIEMLDRADNGDEKAQALNRFLTPMTKKWTAENSVYIVRESMELMGGIGYIEDGVVPKIMRDVMVLPIWEGAGNIMTLDMLRASYKSKGLDVMLGDIREIAGRSEEHNAFMKKMLSEVEREMKTIQSGDQESIELTAKYLFDQLTTLYQFALLVAQNNEDTKNWMQPSIEYLKLKLKKENPGRCLTQEEIEGLMGWEID
ncbi:MAG: acyl-CoA dehydrogenase family protein [Bacteroidota bacterium]